jgi:hypothetical protein
MQSGHLRPSLRIMSTDGILVVPARAELLHNRHEFQFKRGGVAL